MCIRDRNVQINYRLDYTVDDMGNKTSNRLVPYRTQSIAARQQMQFGSEWHPVQMSDIVGQLERNSGAVHADNIRTAKRMGRVKLIWQQDKPISAAVLRDVVDHNVGILSEQGARRRAGLAIAADQNLASLIGETPVKMEMEFESFEEADDGNAPSLVEGLRVSRNTPPASGRKSRGKGPAARAAA